MKKVLSMVFAIMMLMSCMTAAMAAPGDTGEMTAFDLTLTSLLDVTAEEWMSSSETRALLTVLLALDMRLAVGEESPIAPMLDGPTFSGVGDGYLVICTPTETDGMGIVLIYFADMKAAYYMTAEYGEYDFETLFDIVMEGLCPTGYYLNDPDDIYEAMLELAALIGGE